jgi:hypothetical protein
MKGQAREESRAPRRFDASVPHPARMWNYWLGGKDHFAADREAAEQVAREIPLMPVIARATRRFVVDTVEDAALDGIRQFLDIGTGLPVAEGTHQVAQRVSPDARVVYVDNDPVVTSHAQALLVDPGTGLTDYAELDLRDPGAIVARAAKTLDFDEPVVIVLSAIVHFIPDDDDPWAIVARLKDAMAPGSYLLIAHAASDIRPAAVAAMTAGYNERAALPITPRSRQQVTRFLDGLIPAGPGVAPAGRWWQPGPGDGLMPAYFALGRKP